MSDNIVVSIRVRPLIKREVDGSSGFYWDIPSETEITHKTQNKTKFTFDNVFGPEKCTQSVYEMVAQPVVIEAMKGFNGTIFAYGQTSSGKTHTMMGNHRDPGIIPKGVHEIFRFIENTPEREFLIRISYMEIYNESVIDLLSGNKKNLDVRENAQGLVYVDKLKEDLVNSPDQMLAKMRVGEANRHTGSTLMNQRSSRSHTIFRIIIESRKSSENGAVNVAHLNLVDLAGSEKAKMTGAQGSRLVEGGFINQSLFTLGKVISQLSEGAPYVNYRDSKLTRILQNSLGGNSKTAIICNVTPGAEDETLSTLRFGTSAKKIKNKAIVNEVLSDYALMKRYEKQLHELQRELSQIKSTNVHSEKEQLFSEKELLQQRLLEKQKHEQEQQERIDKLTQLICVSTKSQSYTPKKVNKPKRRETWCPNIGLGNKFRNLDRSLELPAAFHKPAFNLSITEEPPRFGLGPLKSFVEEEDECEFSVLAEESFTVFDEQAPINSTRKSSANTEKSQESWCEFESHIEEPAELVESGTQTDVDVAQTQVQMAAEMVCAECQTETPESNLNESIKRETQADFGCQTSFTVSTTTHEDVCQTSFVSMLNLSCQVDTDPEGVANVSILTPKLSDKPSTRGSVSETDFTEAIQLGEQVIKEKYALEQEYRKIEAINQQVMAEKNKIEDELNQIQLSHRKLEEELGRRCAELKELEEFTLLEKDLRDESILQRKAKLLTSPTSVNTSTDFELEQARDRIEELELQLEKYVSGVQVVQQPSEDSETLQNELSKKKDEVECLQQQLLEYEQQLMSRQSSMVQGDNNLELEMLRSELENSREEIEKLKSGIEQVKSDEQTDGNLEAEILKTELEISKEEIEKLKLELEQKSGTEQVADNSLELEMLKAELSSSKETIERLQTELEDRSQVSDNNHEVEMLKTALESTKEEIGRLQQKSEETQVGDNSLEIEMMKAELTHSKEEIERLRQESEEKSQVGDNSLEIEMLKAELADSKEEIERLKTELEQKPQMGDGNLEVEMLTADLERSKEEIGRLQQDLEENNRVGDGNLEVEMIKADLTSSKEEIVRLQAELDERCQNEDSNLEIEMLRSEIESYKQEIEQLKKDLTETPVIAESDSVNLELEVLRSELEKLKEENEKLTEEMTEKNSMVIEAQQKMSDYELQLSENRQQDCQQCLDSNKNVEELTVELNSAREKITQLQQETTDLVRPHEITKLKEEISRLNTALETSRNHEEEMAQKYQSPLPFLSRLTKITQERTLERGKLLSDENRDLYLSKRVEELEQTKQDIIDQFTKINKENEEEIKKLNTQVYETKAQAQKLKGEEEIGRHKLAKADEEIKDLKKEIRDLEDLHAKHDSNINSRQSLDPDKIMDQLKKLRVSHDLNSQRMTKFESENKTLKAEVKKNEDAVYERNNLQGALRELEHTYQQLQNEHLQVKNRYSSSHIEVMNLRDQLLSSGKNLEHTKTLLDHKSRDIEELIQQFDSNSSADKQQREDTLKKLTEKEREMQNVNEKMCRMKEEYELNVKERIITLQNSLAESECATTELQKKFSEKETEMRCMVENFETVKAKIRGEVKENIEDEYMFKMRELENQIEEIETKKENEKQEALTELKERGMKICSDLKEELEIKTTELEILKEEVATETNAKAELLEKLDSQKKELSEKVEHLEQCISELKEKHVIQLSEKEAEYNERLVSADEEKSSANQEELKQKHQTEIEELKQKHGIEIQELTQQHEIEIQELKQKHEIEIDELKQKYEIEVEDQKQNHEIKIEELKIDLEMQILNLTEQLKTSEESIQEKEKYYTEMLSNKDNLIVEIETKHGTEIEEMIEQSKKDYDEKLDMMLKQKQSEIEGVLEFVQNEAVTEEKLKTMNEELVSKQKTINELNDAIETVETAKLELDIQSQEKLIAKDNDISQLEKTVRDLTQELDENQEFHTTELDSKDSEIKQLESSIAVLKEQGVSLTENNQELESKIAQLKQQLEAGDKDESKISDETKVEYEEKVCKLQEEIDVLKTEVLEKEQKLSEQSESVCKECDKLRETVEDLSTENHGLEAQISSLKQLEQSLEDEKLHTFSLKEMISDLENCKEESETMLSEYKDKITGLERDKKHLEEQVLEVVPLIKKVKILEGNVDMIEQLELQISNLQQKLELAQSEKGSTEGIGAELIQLQEKLSDAENHVRKLESELAEKQQEFQQIDSIKSDLLSEVDSLKSELIMVGEEKSRLEEQHSMVIKQKEEEVKEILQFVNKQAHEESKVIDQTDKIQELEAEIVKLQHSAERCNTLESQIKCLEEELQALGVKNRDILKEKDSLIDEIEKKSSQIKEMSEEMNKLEQELLTSKGASSNEDDAYKVKCDHLESTIKELREDLEYELKEKADLMKEADIMEEESDNHTLAKIAWNEQIDQKDAQIEQLQKQLKSGGVSSSEDGSYKVKCESQESTIKELREDLEYELKEKKDLMKEVDILEEESESHTLAKIAWNEQMDKKDALIEQLQKQLKSGGTNISSESDSTKVDQLKLMLAKAKETFTQKEDELQRYLDGNFSCLQNRLEQCESNADILRKQHKSSIKSIKSEGSSEQYKEEVAQLKRNVVSLEYKLVTADVPYKQRIEDLQKDVQEKNSYISRLTNEIRKLKNEHVHNDTMAAFKEHQPRTAGVSQNTSNSMHSSSLDSSSSSGQPAGIGGVSGVGKWVAVEMLEQEKSSLQRENKRLKSKLAEQEKLMKLAQSRKRVNSENLVKTENIVKTESRLSTDQPLADVANLEPQPPRKALAPPKYDTISSSSVKTEWYQGSKLPDFRKSVGGDSPPADAHGKTSKRSGGFSDFTMSMDEEQAELCKQQ